MATVTADLPPFVASPPPQPGLSGSGKAELRFVVLPRSTLGFGFSLKGSSPVHISGVTVDGVAARCGVLPYDEIYVINGQEVGDATHDEVVAIISQAGRRIELGLKSSPPASAVSTSPLIQVNSPNGSRQASTGGDPSQFGDPSQLETTAPDEAAATVGIQLQADEMEAFMPFKDLRLLVKKPAHLATFLHYLMSNGFFEEQMFLYLRVNWFQDAPERAEAMIMYEDFLATNAPVKIEGMSGQVFLELEQALNEKTTQTARLSSIYSNVRDVLEETLNAALKQFEELIVNLGLGNLYGASLLVDLPQAEEGCVVEEMIKPHVDAAREGNSEADTKKRMEVVEDTLIQFMEKSGVNVDKLKETTRERGHSFRRSRSGGRSKGGELKDGSFFRKQKKVHLHAGHHFVTTSYQQPTFCGVCKTLLWGVMRQGWTCIDCGFHVHKSNDMTGRRKCHLQIEPMQACTGIKTQRKTMFARRSNRGKDKSIRRSTNCDESGAVIADMAAGEAANPGSLDAPEASSGPPSPRSLTPSRSKLVPQESVDVPVELKLPEDPGEEPELWRGTVIDQKILKKKDLKKEVKRQELVYELIQTEKGYMRHLNILQQLFRAPIRAEGLFTADNLQDLFSNLDDLVHMNTPLYTSLKDLQAQHAGQIIPEVGAAMLQGLDKIDPQAYAVFCSNQTAAVAFYHEKMKGYHAFAKRIQASEAHPVCGRLSFTDFVAKPLQRLTKYPLLFKGILKTTDEKNKAERDAISKCVEKAEYLLRYVQEKVRDSEDKIRMKELNDKLDRAGLTNYEKHLTRDLHLSGRKLIYEGSMQMKIQDRMHDVVFMLLTDIILIGQFKDEKFVMKLSKAKNSAIIHLGSAMIRPCATNNKALFLISTSRHSTATTGPQMYELVAASKTLAREWEQRVNSSIENFKRDNPDWEAQLKQFLADREQEEAERREEAEKRKASKKSIPALAAESEDEDEPDMSLDDLLEQMRRNSAAQQELQAKVMHKLQVPSSDGPPRTAHAQRQSRFSRVGRRPVRRNSKDRMEREVSPSPRSVVDDDEMDVGFEAADMEGDGAGRDDDLAQKYAHAMATISVLEAELATLRVQVAASASSSRRDTHSPRSSQSGRDASPATRRSTHTQSRLGRGSLPRQTTPVEDEPQPTQQNRRSILLNTGDEAHESFI